MNLAVKNLVLQGDANAAGFTILNLNLSGLGLTKNSVGLGNVDNTSDASKPVSVAQAAAIALRELAIAPGTSADYWRGDKTWQTLGALALQGGNTTLQELSAIGLNATGASAVSARRNDYVTGPSYADVSLNYYGASSVGSLLGLSNANAGALRFQNSTYSFIYSNNTSPLIFGYNGIRRMRLMTGLTVGGDTDPGIGCIRATGNIEALGQISATGTILAGGAIGGGFGVITTTLEVGTSVLIGTDLSVGDDITVAGDVNFAGLPTADPAVVGRLWRSGADIKVSI